MKTLNIVLSRLIALSIVTFLATAAVHAQSLGLTSESGESAVELSEDLTREEVRDLVSTLTDADVRRLLLERMDAVAQDSNVAGEQTGAVDFLSQMVTANIEAISIPVQRLPMLWTSQKSAFGTFIDRFGTPAILQMLGTLLLAIVVGFIAERLVIAFTRRIAALNPGHPIENGTLRQTLAFLSKRLLGEIAGLIAFFIVARLIGRSLIAPEMGELASTIMVNMVVIPRIGYAVFRFLMAPDNPSLRLVHTYDETAKFGVRHAAGLLLLIGFSDTIIHFNGMNGLEGGQIRLGFWLNLSVHLYIIWVTFRHWDGWVVMARGSDPDVTPTEERISHYYPVFVVALSILTWILVNILAGFERFDLLGTGAHYYTMALLTMAPTFDTLVRGLVRHMVPAMQGEGVIAERAYRATKRSYIRMGRVIVFAAVILIITRLWGLDLENLAAAGVGARIAGRMIEALMILAVGYFIYELVSLLINRKLAAEMTAAGFDINEEEPGGGEGGGAGSSRLSTVLPLLLGAVRIAIIVVFLLLALGTLGIDTTPLLAGAGIFGLAIGFGAQKLVGDVVSGIFFLIDDAFRAGEYVSVDSTMGTVENISIRSLQLRHHKGPVHTIPYGEIPQITNYSRDWVIMKLRFTVPFGTDPNKVKKIFKGIGAEMMEDPLFKGDMMQPFKSQGVFDFDDVGMIIRGKFMAKPGTQFTMRKEIFNRVKAAFEANGIEFARREVRVAIPGLENADDLNENQKTQIKAAAAQAAQEQAPEEKPAK